MNFEDISDLFCPCGHPKHLHGISLHLPSAHLFLILVKQSVMLAKAQQEEITLKIRYEEARTQAEKASVEVETARTEIVRARHQEEEGQLLNCFFFLLINPVESRNVGVKRSIPVDDAPAEKKKRGRKPGAAKIVQREPPAEPKAPHGGKKGRGRPRKNPA